MATYNRIIIFRNCKFVVMNLDNIIFEKCLIPSNSKHPIFENLNHQNIVKVDIK